MERKDTLSLENQEYDSWIRAAPVSMPRKSVVRVPRFYAAKKKSQKVGEHKGDENLRPATRVNPVTSAPHNQPQDMDTMDFTDEIEVNQIKKESTIKSLNFSQFGSRLRGAKGMELKGMKIIILEYSSLPLFGSFNDGNRKSISLFGS